MDSYWHIHINRACEEICRVKIHHPPPLSKKHQRWQFVEGQNKKTSRRVEAKSETLEKHPKSLSCCIVFQKKASRFRNTNIYPKSSNDSPFYCNTRTFSPMIFCAKLLLAAWGSQQIVWRIPGCGKLCGICDFSPVDDVHDVHDLHDLHDVHDVHAVHDGDDDDYYYYYYYHYQSSLLSLLLLAVWQLWSEMMILQPIWG